MAPDFLPLSLLFLSLRKPDLCRRFLLLALIDLVLVGWMPASEAFLRVLDDAVPKTPIAQIAEVGH